MCLPTFQFNIILSPSTIRHMFLNWWIFVSTLSLLPACLSACYDKCFCISYGKLKCSASGITAASSRPTLFDKRWQEERRSSKVRWGEARHCVIGTRSPARSTIKRKRRSIKRLSFSKATTMDREPTIGRRRRRSSGSSGERAKNENTHTSAHSHALCCTTELYRAASERASS